MLCPPLVENYWGKNRGRSVRKRGADEKRGGGREEVWTRDKEARGRAGRKQRYMGTGGVEGGVYKPETQI